MKRGLIVAGAILIFCVGFIVGQQHEILPILAKDSPLITSASTPSPTPVFIPQETPISTPIETTHPAVLPTAGGGPKNDIIEIQQITASKPVAQVGDDIGFTVTIKNQAPYKKLVKQLCFNSNEGNFGCSLDFNLYPGESFNFNNSGRFTKGGVKTIWITWTQDGQNFYRPVNGGTVQVTIQQ